MTREEKISKAAYSQYCNSESICFTMMCDSFKQGAKWADKNPQSPWISVKDDLPCNHKELIEGVNTKIVIIYTGATLCSNRMNYINGKWQWFGGRKVTHWMPIPEPPKK